MIVLRHLLAIAVLPFTVTVLIPVWIGRTNHVSARVGATAAEVALQAAGLVAIAIGLLLFAFSLGNFATKGRGTLAPWDPPKHLVVNGPYRYVRNPMISGVIFIVAGEAGALLSRPHAMWALTFLGFNAIFIPLLEEPQLRARFGAPYDEYRRHVRRFIPRLRPWTPEASPSPTSHRGAPDRRP